MNPPDDMRACIGIDPGQTAGVALLSWAPDAPLAGWNVFGMFQMTPDEFTRYALTLDQWRVRTDGTTYVALEQYQIQPRSARTAHRAASQLTLEQIGLVKAVVPADKLIVRTPAAVKPWATDKRLNTIGAGVGNPRHARDAARHALYALVHDLGCPDPLTVRD